ncbi:Sec63-domain-containing protein [Fomitopsis serialis]|uniref:Sec63-domain-containing protein n=1 Tax=Fomitopsis serialis TaxID=139415 RepID=UPI002007FF00|nr:Sec63-domain-containing protein [Neoantrodia serialis]KAH9938549.1 Sec63-domain-containing protein [Neoantrodia serialis]
MSDFLSHIQYLTGSPDESSDRDGRVVEEWTRKHIVAEDTQAASLPEDVEEWDSVLSIYSTQSMSEAANRPPVLSKILACEPNLRDVLPALSPILNSKASDDLISEQLAEIIGFDDIELVDDYLHGIQNGHASHALMGKQLGDQMYDTSSLDPEAARRRMEETLRSNAARPLYTGTAHDAPEVLPHVYTSASTVQGNILSHLGTRFMLPLGTTREMNEDYEEVTIPPARAVAPRATERLITVSELDSLARGSFPGYTSLNRIQSIVYPTAYQSNENMLVCAPTGAGKTDVAMSANTNNSIAASIQKDKFKVIYVAPMKALASEIVRKLGKRLKWLQVLVRELTAHKAEIAETQIIVTTPEKWDVVTRKPTGEGELASQVKLLIIDEVHLLNDERGAVIETIVARTLRQASRVESTQSVIRIVGLSATLPNYVDVGDFLRVNRHTGLFYFDSSFRPVPLEQHFIGVKGKPGSQQSRKNLDHVSFEKVSELVQEGHQVMVFVHARKETVKTALALKEAAMADGILDEFSCEDHPQFEFFRRDIGMSRNKEMKQLFDNGFGIHHAGMLRSDRNMMERMFEARAIKVLCCTATLAWGVNLPAHAVIIKGTQVYDSAKGSFTDLSVLDVLQVFGRAGRPGLETSGVGYICTTDDKLQHYLDSVTSQNPIESKFIAGIIDALNAEIALGTVANVPDAVQWIGYTYLFVRMRKNPFQYGMTRDQVAEDPYLGAKRTQLVIEAATRLAEARMITFDRTSRNFTILDLGRIAAKYYIRHASIEIFNKVFKPKMTEADVLVMLCMSTEFDQIQLRENEVKELAQLLESELVPCTVKSGTDTSQGKVNILLQSYISDVRPEDFALVSDQAYAAQNGGRIVRALLEIAISRKWANVSGVLMGLSKAIEKRLWPFDQPLKQFQLKRDVLYNLERWADEYSVAELAAMPAVELGQLVKLNEHHGNAIRDAAKQFPTVGITYKLRPLGSNVLRISPFWLWIEDDEGINILQMSHLVFRQTTDALDVDFVISISEGQRPPFVTIRFVSDKWMGAEDEVAIPFDDLVMPSASESHTPRLDIPFLPVSVLHNPVVEKHMSGRIHSFNALQSHALWSLVNTPLHALFCAPTGSGKSTLAQAMAWNTLQTAAETSWVLVIAPRRSVATEMITQMRPVSKMLNVWVELSQAEGLFSTSSRKTIRVATGVELLRAISHKRVSGSALTGLKLVVCENLELLDSAYELGVSLLIHAAQSHPVRFVGLSNSLNDSADLAAWLDVDPLALHSFRPSDRDQSLTVHTQTFTTPQSAALFKAMAKPAHMAIQRAPGGSAIVFIPSRAQCRPIALDLITQCALELETARGYLPEDVAVEAFEHYRPRLKDGELMDYISRGVGFFHEGIAKEDRSLMLELYAQGLVRVLIVPRDACWTLPVRAVTVVVMGTQYLHVTDEERQLRDYGLEELVRMQGRAVRHNGEGYFHLFCQVESKDTFMRFLNDGLPLESQLLQTDVLRSWYKDRRKDGSIADKQQAVDALSFTFLARRLTSNPVYYDCSSTSVNELLSRVVDSLDEDVAGG